MKTLKINQRKFKTLYNSKTKALQVLLWIWANAESDGTISVSNRESCEHIGISVRQFRTAVDTLVNMNIITKHSEKTSTLLTIIG